MRRTTIIALSLVLSGCSLSRDEGLRRQYQAEQQQKRQAQVAAEAKAQRAAAEAHEQQRKEASDEALRSMQAAALLFVDCVVRYVLQRHPAPRMTASELADAGVSSCAAILDDVRRYAQVSGLGILDSDERRHLADQAAAKAIEVAHGKALQALAERPRS